MYVHHFCQDPLVPVMLIFVHMHLTNPSYTLAHPRTVFLFQLLALILFLVCEVFLQLNLLDIPFHLLLRRTFPTLYSPEETANIHVHPYLTLGLLSVSVTTLVLFFVSGMYSEKIAYANRLVSSTMSWLRRIPHCNADRKTWSILTPP